MPLNVFTTAFQPKTNAPSKMFLKKKISSHDITPCLLKVKVYVR